MLIATWHFSFTVADIERSVEFYRDILGMELVHRQEQSNAYTRKFVGYPDAHLKVAQLKIKIDEAKRKKEAQTIMQSDYYKSLKEKVKTLREQKDK